MSAPPKNSQSGLSPADEHSVLARAYVPEHIVSLMARVSKATAFLLDDFLGFARDNWLILVGYPLEGGVTQARYQALIDRVLEVHRPEYLWYIGPEIPDVLLGDCQRHETDQYYRLDIERFQLRSPLRRALKRASEGLTVERGHRFTREHRKLVSEFMGRQELPPMVAGLYRAMPDYLKRSTSACVLNARDRRGKLSAFFVVEMAAQSFDAYVLGCHSRNNYVPYASDYLFYEMVELARQRGKRFINLGLGVNDGIRRFKTKWGGEPFLNYEFCERRYARSQVLSTIDLLLEGKL